MSVLDAPIDFTSNRIVDLIFAIDVVITFFLPYRAPAKEGGGMVYVRVVHLRPNLVSPVHHRLLRRPVRAHASLTVVPRLPSLLGLPTGP